MCIIGAVTLNNQLCLIKVRDRNYTPRLYLCHKKIKGTEVVFYVDAETSWVEGMNEHGITVVNSALMIHSDENEQEERDTKSEGARVSKDGVRIYYLLAAKTIKEALKRFKEGSVLKGHTLLTDGKELYHIEAVDDNPTITKLDPKEPHVFTNHGIDYPDQGYAPDTEDGKSSRVRRHQALKVFREEGLTPSNLATTLIESRLSPKKRYPFDMIRDIHLKTSSIAVFNVTKGTLDLTLLPDKVILENIVEDKGLAGNGKLKAQFVFEPR